VGSAVSLERYDRVVERRRSVAVARHLRDFEELSIAQIAERLGRSPATIKAYFYDPTGEKARAVKARYVGVCRGCGAYTQPRNGKGDAYAYCKACHPGAIQRRWTRERVLEAMGEWRDCYGQLPSSYDWSRTHARRRGGEVLRRLEAGKWPPASVVTSVFGSWATAREAAGANAEIGPEPGDRQVHGHRTVGGREPERMAAVSAHVAGTSASISAPRTSTGSGPAYKGVDASGAQV
jgi:hypothetical protein